MKKVLKVIGVLLLLIIAFVLIAGIFVSKVYHLERDITINAPRDTVWNNVSSLRAMMKWSPWTDPDPNVQLTYEGEDGAIGSTFHWKGNKDVGSGNQTITSVDKPSSIKSHINFIEPFSGQADAYISLADVGGSTKATWGLDIKYPYPMNVMQLFVNMDDMMGKQYNTGLSRLKKLSEHQ